MVCCVVNQIYFSVFTARFSHKSFHPNFNSSLHFTPKLSQQLPSFNMLSIPYCPGLTGYKDQWCILLVCVSSFYADISECRICGNQSKWGEGLSWRHVVCSMLFSWYSHWCVPIYIQQSFLTHRYLFLVRLEDLVNSMRVTVKSRSLQPIRTNSWTVGKINSNGLIDLQGDSKHHISFINVTHAQLFHYWASGCIPTRFISQLRLERQPPKHEQTRGVAEFSANKIDERPLPAILFA